MGVGAQDGVSQEWSYGRDPDERAFQFLRAPYISQYITPGLPCQGSKVYCVYNA